MELQRKFSVNKGCFKKEASFHSYGTNARTEGLPGINPRAGTSRVFEEIVQPC